MHHTKLWREPAEEVGFETPSPPSAHNGRVLLSRGPPARTLLTLTECTHLAAWGALLDVAEETSREQPCAAHICFELPREVLAAGPAGLVGAGRC
jgi:hypothetical protein